MTGTATTADPFSVVSGGNYILDPDGNQIVTVRYMPTSLGSHNGTMTLTGGDGTIVRLTGVAVPFGTVVVNPDPDSINASWTLTGPYSYSQSGTGDQTLNNLPAGDYTLTWGNMLGWTRPTPVSEKTKNVADGGTTIFVGTYVQQTGTVFINPDPDSIAAPWTVTGPYGYSNLGTGDQTLSNLPIGDYTITWGNVAGWDQPASETKAIIDGGTTTFSGTYSQPIIPIIQVTPGNLNFGYVPVGSTKDLTLTVTNIGGGTLTLTGNATTSAPFSIFSGDSYTLNPGQTRAVTVRYQPTSPGPHTSTVVFTGREWPPFR